MATEKNAVYKVHNGTDFDTINFKTKASQVIANDGSNLETHLAESVTQGNPHGIDALANKSWGDVISVTLVNGWTGTLQYSKNDLGEVWLRGSVIAGTVDTTKAIGAITTGYTPEQYVPIVACQSTSGLVALFGCIEPGPGARNILIRRNSLMELEVETGKTYRINMVYKV